MKKARQVEFQKLQRKDRKERKEIAKLTNSIRQLEEQLSQAICTDQADMQCSNQTKLEKRVDEGVIIANNHDKNEKENLGEQVKGPSEDVISLKIGDSEYTLHDENPMTSNETSKRLSCRGGQTSHLLEKDKGNMTEATCLSEGGISKAKINETPIPVPKDGKNFFYYVVHQL